jgi:ABC-2 type transport system ATP-binding protein
MNKVIEVKSFYKGFDKLQVVKNLSFDVFEGELFAFLGANGSGKTTTLRCLLNIYTADSGELLINGRKYTTKDASFVGYLPEERGLYTNSNVLETMTYFGQIKGLSFNDAKTESLRFLDRVGLLDKKDITIKKLSSGQQQKIQLGITIINRPKLLVLDEPTKGLDPVNRTLLLDILKELNKDYGSTIIFSTHQMDEVEKIADRLLMIKDGTSVLYGELDDVKKQFGENTLHLDYHGKFLQNSKLFIAEVEKNHAEIHPRENVTGEEILSYLLKNGISVKTFRVDAPSLNEIFIKVATEKNA